MHSSTKAFSLVGGASLGAGLMFFLDPDRGNRRRALMRDQGVRWSRKTRDFAGSTARDVRNRARGMGATAKSWIQPAPPVSDQVVVERVRAKLGLYSRYPSAIKVHVRKGAVTVTGPVLEDEFDSISGAIAHIPGVTQFFNHMERHQAPDIPALQGPLGSKRGPRFAFMQSHWSPTARTAAALMGSAALVYGLSQRTVGSTTLAASGLGLLVRSATNQKFTRLLKFKEQGERQHLPKAA